MRALSELLDCGISRSSIRKSFSRFSCKRNSDVSFFLKAHAMQNERSGASRTYLALDRQRFNGGTLSVAAFFTLAVTATDFGNISIDERIKILGRASGIDRVVEVGVST